MANNMLTDNLSEPLNGTKSAKVDINAGTGNLTIDPLPIGEQVLATGTLQYFEDQGQPTRTRDSSNSRSTFTLRGRASGGRPWFRFPWAACNEAADWQIHLNPTVASDIIAHSDGGNVKLNLAGMAVTHVAADTGGGNMDVILPDNSANLSVAASTGAGNVTVEIGSDIHGTEIVTASSGAGNVVIHLPNAIPAKIHATSRLGRVMVDPQFSLVDDNTYRSLDYDTAPDKVEITASSGGGNVNVNSR